ncbi:MAG TPA: hypothetical protein VEQ59_14755 [Polyangiaceae bacterium]|nr:hypothetical protein [Polyangiaceae bacterium]
MKRRALLASSLLGAFAARALCAEPKRLESDELSLIELSVPGDAAFGRALVGLPRPLPERPDLLLLLHGLGETTDPELGAHAFAERYGLLSAVQRLTHPPLVRQNLQRDYFEPGRLPELNARLAQRPYQAPVLVCPFTPNPYKRGGGEVLQRFAAFVVGPLKAAVEAHASVAFPGSRSMISGVSLGGYLAMEIFLKSPEQFCGLGAAQAAFRPNQAARYAARIAEQTARVGSRRIELLTSSYDPYRSANELLHRHLVRQQQASRLRVSPGAHDQAWLNESGTIDMLLAADDVFAEQRAVSK